MRIKMVKTLSKEEFPMKRYDHFRFKDFSRFLIDFS